MLFTSLEFVIFLAAVLVVYYLTPRRFQWIVLLIFSYIFYWLADPRYLIFIVTTTVSAYLITRRLEKIQ